MKHDYGVWTYCETGSTLNVLSLSAKYSFAQGILYIVVTRGYLTTAYYCRKVSKSFLYIQKSLLYDAEKTGIQNSGIKLSSFSYWLVPEVIADFFIQIKHIFVNTRNEL